MRLLYKSLIFIILFSFLVAGSVLILFQFKSDKIWMDYSEDTPYQVEEIASGFSIPWAMDFIDHENLIVTERLGNIGITNIKTGEYQFLKKINQVFVKRECGLHDIKFSPNYADDKLVYFTYAKDINGAGYTSLAKARLIDHELHEIADIFISTHPATDDGRHCGSRIAFDNNGHLFMSIGDRGARDEAQNTLSHAGSIIRLNLDGSVPDDNPFKANSEFLPEIWSYGHRNPQGLFYDEESQRLWSNEHGPKGGDEINIIRSGLNYGWPIITHGKEYFGPKIGEGAEKEGLEQPLKIWNPSIAPSSLLLYTGSAFADWHGNLFSTSLVQQHLNRLVVDSTGRIIFEERLLEDLNERFRAIIEDGNGNIIVSTDNGRILKVSPAETDDWFFTNFYRHIDMPGFYISFDLKFAYW